MLVTASENQTGLGSLVGVKAERLPSLQYPEFDKLCDRTPSNMLQKTTVFYSSQSAHLLNSRAALRKHYTSPEINSA
jgi:hypothetical protein